MNLSRTTKLNVPICPCVATREIINVSIKTSINAARQHPDGATRQRQGGACQDLAGMHMNRTLRTNTTHLPCPAPTTLLSVSPHLSLTFPQTEGTRWATNLPICIRRRHLPWGCRACRRGLGSPDSGRGLYSCSLGMLRRLVVAGCRLFSGGMATASNYGAHVFLMIFGQLTYFLGNSWMYKNW